MMTTAAIMQPYLFPYVGYYQLVASADVFVFLDDAYFIKRGFINRNTVIDPQGRAVRFTLPVRHQSQNRPINDHVYGEPGDKPVRTMSYCYHAAPGFETYFRMFTDIVHHAAGRPVSEVNAASIVRVAEALGMATRFLSASRIDPRPADSGQARILRVCTELGAQRYLNLPGGRSLYDSDAFAAAGIELQFIEPQPPSVPDSDSSTLYPSFLHDLMTLERDRCIAALRSETSH